MFKVLYGGKASDDREVRGGVRKSEISSKAEGLDHVKALGEKLKTVRQVGNLLLGGAFIESELNDMRDAQYSSASLLLMAPTLSPTPNPNRARPVL